MFSVNPAFFPYRGWLTGMARVGVDVWAQNSSHTVAASSSHHTKHWWFCTMTFKETCVDISAHKLFLFDLSLRSACAMSLCSLTADWEFLCVFAAWASVDVSMEDRVEVYIGDKAEILCHYAFSGVPSVVMIQWFVVSTSHSHSIILCFRIISEGKTFLLGSALLTSICLLLYIVYSFHYHIVNA